MLTAMPNGPTWNGYNLTGLSQVSTASLVDVAGSILDLALCRNGNGSYSVKKTAGNNVDVQLFGSNDLTTWIAVGAQTTVSAANSFSFGPSQSSWYRYYKLQIIDTSGGSHGTVGVTGFVI